MLKILNYAPMFLPHLGGTELNIYYSAQYSKHRHFVLTDMLPGGSRLEKIDNIVVHRVPPTRRISPIFLDHLQNLWLDFPRELLKLFMLRSLEYDILHLRAPFIVADLFWLVDHRLGKTVFKKAAPWKLVKKPIVVTFHALPHQDVSVPNLQISNYPTNPKEKLSWLQFEKTICDAACAIICVDRYMVRALSNLVNEEKLYYIPSGIDINLFRPKSREVAISALPPFVASHFSKDVFHVLYAGRLDFFRGAHTLSNLSMMLPNDCKLIVTGRPNVSLDIRLGKAVYLGSISNNSMPDLINACDAIFNPVLSNGISRITLEGMACAKPVIMFSLGMDRFPGVDRKNVLLVKSTKEAADIIAELRDDPSFSIGIGENARRIAEQCSVQNLAQQIDEIYERAYS